MRNIIAGLFILLTLAACSDATRTSLINFNNAVAHDIDNFNAVADAFDNTVATRISPTLARYCSSAISTGKSLSSLAGQSGTAHTALVTVTTGVSSWCDNPQPQTVGDAVAAMAQVVSDAIGALKKARAGG